MESGDILLSILLGNEGWTKVDKMVRNKWTRKRPEQVKFLKKNNGKIT
jgi:hypothetical protein